MPQAVQNKRAYSAKLYRSAVLLLKRGSLEVSARCRCGPYPTLYRTSGRLPMRFQHLPHSSYFPSQNRRFGPTCALRVDRSYSFSPAQLSAEQRAAVVRGLGASRRQSLAQIDEVVGQHSHADPSFHSLHAGIAAAVQSVTSFEYTNPTFAAGSPGFAAFLNQRSFLKPLSLCAAGLPIGVPPPIAHPCLAPLVPEPDCRSRHRR